MIRPSAMRTINELADYIINEVNMPETAIKYTDNLINFAYELAEHWKAYKTCRYRFWAEMGLKCAVFDKKYVFAFKIIKNTIVVYHIKHGKLLQ